MIIDKDSIEINGISMAQYLSRAKFGYYKTWSNDTGYNLANKFTGTFTGLFPKLTLTFVRLKPEQIRILAPIFDSIKQNVTYEDPVVGKTTMPTHTGDWEIEFVRMNQGQPFTISFISNIPRGD